MKKLVCLLLALVMIFSLAACNNNENPDASSSGDTSKGDTSNPTGSNSGETSQGEDVEPEPYVGPDWDAIDAMDYDEASDAVYDWNLGEFNEYYQAAKAEINDTELRLALMAIAEAKLMESGMFIPTTGDGGNYAMTRIAPRTGTTVSWGLDEYKYYTYLITEELIKATDRTAIVGLWTEAESADAFFAAAKAYLADKGYTLTDTYNYNAGTYQPRTWDVIASSYTADSLFVAPTYSGLLEYDALNVQQPALATSYEVSDDALTYTFHLREGVKWVDNQGTVIGEVTADDWVASMQHLADNNDALGWLLSVDEGCGIKNYDAYVNGDITDFSLVGVEAVDDYTLVYTLENPFPAFVTMMGYGCFAPLNRSFYKAQGGTFSAEGDEYTAGNYATSPETIAYTGAYLCTSYTETNIATYVANPEYWNKDAVNVTAVNYHYNSGEDVTRAYTETKNGVFTACGFNASALELARTEIPEGETETYYDLYSYTTTNSATTYGGWFNLNRGTWTNYNDETMGVSEHTDADKERTRAALNNQHMRLAIAFGFDRAAYNAQSVGEELKYAALKNTYVTGNFDALLTDVTVDINGTATTFKAGTFYGEIMQAQIDADGYPITVWDPTADDGIGSSDGFDGWYNVANAKAELELAIAELAEIGIEVSAENPILIDYPYASWAEVNANRANALKQSIETALEGKVIITLVDFPDADTLQTSYYYYPDGASANFDLSLGSGWGPDYQDPQSFLDTVQPYGYMTKNFGLY